MTNQENNMEDFLSHTDVFNPETTYSLTDRIKDGFNTWSKGVKASAKNTVNSINEGYNSFKASAKNFANSVAFAAPIFLDDALDAVYHMANAKHARPSGRSIPIGPGIMAVAGMTTGVSSALSAEENENYLPGTLSVDLDNPLVRGALIDLGVDNVDARYNAAEIFAIRGGEGKKEKAYVLAFTDQIPDGNGRSVDPENVLVLNSQQAQSVLSKTGHSIDDVQYSSDASSTLTEIISAYQRTKKNVEKRGDKATTEERNRIGGTRGWNTLDNNKRGTSLLLSDKVLNLYNDGNGLVNFVNLNPEGDISYSLVSPDKIESTVKEEMRKKANLPKGTYNNNIKQLVGDIAPYIVTDSTALSSMEAAVQDGILAQDERKKFGKPEEGVYLLEINTPGNKQFQIIHYHDEPTPGMDKKESKGPSDTPTPKKKGGTRLYAGIEGGATSASSFSADGQSVFSLYDSELPFEKVNMNAEGMIPVYAVSLGANIDDKVGLGLGLATGSGDISYDQFSNKRQSTRNITHEDVFIPTDAAKLKQMGVLVDVDVYEKALGLPFGLGLSYEVAKQSGEVQGVGRTDTHFSNGEFHAGQSLYNGAAKLDQTKQNVQFSINKKLSDNIRMKVKVGKNGVRAGAQIRF